MQKETRTQLMHIVTSEFLKRILDKEIASTPTLTEWI